jgi:uncharacterized membrane-anchored protein YitT (DUF2179 family)
MDAGEPPPSPRHSAFEDAQGLVFGTAMVTLGLAFLQHLGLITGQIAGLALLVSLWTGVAFGPVFFALNLPFYWLAVRRMGWAFTIKTFAAVVLVTVFSLVRPELLTFGHVDPLTGAVLAGIVQGSGLLAIFRHRASLGGVGVVAVYLQDRTGFRAGWTQLLVDLVVFALALLTLPVGAVLFSLAGAVVLNLVIAINHRRDRYIGM